MRTPDQGLASRLRRHRGGSGGRGPSPLGAVRPHTGGDRPGTAARASGGSCPPDPPRRGTVGREPCPRSLRVALVSAEAQPCCPPSPRRALSPRVCASGHPPPSRCSLSTFMRGPRPFPRGTWGDQKLVLSDSFIHRTWSSELDQVQVMGGSMYLAYCKAIKMKFYESWVSASSGRAGFWFQCQRFKSYLPLGFYACYCLCESVQSL